MEPKVLIVEDDPTLLETLEYSLKRQGYQVTYREFEGKHTLPPEVAQEAMRWFLKA